jgi:type VI secretion system protein ImpM
MFLPISRASRVFRAVNSDMKTGVYGKLPSHGDFVSRDLYQAFVKEWDDWLQSGLDASRKTLKEHWNDVFLTSPIWRFVLAPGVIGDACWLGCISPSSDSVGRIFPVTFAREYPAATNPFLLAMRSEPWMRAVEKEILNAFDAAARPVESILEAVNAIESPELGEALPRSPELGFGESWCYRGFGSPSGFFTAHLSDQMLSHQLGTYAMWWVLGSQSLQPSVLLTRQLPDAHQFSAMISGSWSEQGWYVIDRTDSV